MKYIVLLRGINVGGNRKVEMKKLKILFEKLDYQNVSTYINSGNVIFESTRNKKLLTQEITKNLKEEFGFEIPTLLKTDKEMQKIAQAIPDKWQNNTQEKTDVAYLFEDVDSKKIFGELPMNRDYINIIYVKGAVIWNVNRKNYNKSRLNKVIGHKVYQSMTVRNVNTARFLGNLK